MKTPEQCVKFFSKLTIKKPEGLHWLYTGIFIVTFEQILFFALVYLFFEQAYASWLELNFITKQRLTGSKAAMKTI